MHMFIQYICFVFASSCKHPVSEQYNVPTGQPVNSIAETNQTHNDDIMTRHSANNGRYWQRYSWLS